MKVYVSDWGTYGLIEFMDVAQNLVLIIVVTNIGLRVELLVAKPPQEGRFQFQFPVVSLGNLQAIFSFCPHSVVLEFTQPLKEMITKEFPWL